jgi:hypothetical protein
VKCRAGLHLCAAFFMNKWIKIIQSIARDSLILASVASICYGAHLIYHPIAWIIGGVIMFWVTIPGRKEAK